LQFKKARKEVIEVARKKVRKSPDQLRREAEELLALAEKIENERYVRIGKGIRDWYKRGGLDELTSENLESFREFITRLISTERR